MELKEVSLNDEAKEFINEKSSDNSITITFINASSGWHPVLEPSVKMGKPKQNSVFKLFKSNGIDVYVSDHIRTRGEKIEISMGKFLWRRYIKVDGIRVG